MKVKKKTAEVLRAAFAQAKPILNSSNKVIFSYSKTARVPHHLLTIGHLFIYGKLKYRQFLERRRKEGLPYSTDAINEWWHICFEIETMLREHRIYSDTTIANVITLVTGQSVINLCYNTMREDGNRKFFPATWGLPVAFLPFALKDDEAEYIVRNLKCGTFNELYAKFITTPTAFRNDFLDELSSCFFTRPLIQEIEEHFVTFKKYA